MTDKELKQEALTFQKKGYFYWSEVMDLVEKAVSIEAKNFINAIAVRMYRREEAACGLM